MWSGFLFVQLLHESVNRCPGALQEEEVQKQQRQLQEDRQEWQRKKDEYQKDLERLRDAQRKLDRDKEAVQRQMDKMGDARLSEVSPLPTSCSGDLRQDGDALSSLPPEDSLHHL